jgi:hypothetical protein
MFYTSSRLIPYLVYMFNKNYITKSRFVKRNAQKKQSAAGQGGQRRATPGKAGQRRQRER